MDWPFQLIARLLSAAVESHHPMALAPHVLADDPLGGVAGSSPQERYSLFELHSAEEQKNEMSLQRESYSVSIKTLSSLTQIVACWLMIFCPHCHSCIQAMVSCLSYQRCLICADSQKKKNILFCSNMSVCNLINHHVKIPTQLWFPYPTSYIKCTGLFKLRHRRNESGSLNDEFVLSHNIRARWDMSLCYHSYLPL